MPPPWQSRPAFHALACFSLCLRLVKFPSSCVNSIARSSKMNKFSGLKYKLAKSEKFDEYMKALGVGLMTRTVGNSVSPIVELVVDGEEYTLKSSSTFKNTVLKFKLNQEFDQETPDGRKVKTTFTLSEENQLVEEQKGDKDTKIVREFSPEEISMTLTVDDIVCTRIYKLVE